MDTPTIKFNELIKHIDSETGNVSLSYLKEKGFSDIEISKIQKKFDKIVSIGDDFFETNKIDPKECGFNNICFSLSSKEDGEKNITKWKKQRLSKGFDETELLNLDSTIINFILPRLKEFKKIVKNNPSIPYGIKSLKEWEDILDKMIWAFEESLDLHFKKGDSFYDFIKKENNKEITLTETLKKYNKDHNFLEEEKKKSDLKNEGIELFCKYLGALWI